VAAVPPRGRVVVAGLPEKYGTSLDFFLVAAELDAEIVVLDDREAAIERSKRAVDSLGGAGALGLSRVTYENTPLETLPRVARGDLLLSCEVLQRVPAPAQSTFVSGLREGNPRGAIFVPNSANRSHHAISGLAGFDEAALRGIVGAGPEIDFVDMPPFPPGITRSASQRTRASSGWVERAAMRGLDVYCYAERFVPRSLKARIAHILCARWT
jgi:hypothetical protein